MNDITTEELLIDFRSKLLEEAKSLTREVSIYISMSEKDIRGIVKISGKKGRRLFRKINYLFCTDYTKLVMELKKVPRGILTKEEIGESRADGLYISCIMAVDALISSIAPNGQFIKTVTTCSFIELMARQFNYSNEEVNKIVLASLCHDSDNRYNVPLGNYHCYISKTLVQPLPRIICGFPDFKETSPSISHLALTIYLMSKEVNKELINEMVEALHNHNKAYYSKNNDNVMLALNDHSYEAAVSFLDEAYFIITNITDDCSVIINQELMDEHEKLGHKLGLVGLKSYIDSAQAAKSEVLKTQMEEAIAKKRPISNELQIAYGKSIYYLCAFKVLYQLTMNDFFPPIIKQLVVEKRITAEEAEVFIAQIEERKNKSDSHPKVAEKPVIQEKKKALPLTKDDAIKKLSDLSQIKSIHELKKIIAIAGLDENSTTNYLSTYKEFQEKEKRRFYAQSMLEDYLHNLKAITEYDDLIKYFDDASLDSEEQKLYLNKYYSEHGAIEEEPLSVEQVITNYITMYQFDEDKVKVYQDWLTTYKMALKYFQDRKHFIQEDQIKIDNLCNAVIQNPVSFETIIEHQEEAIQDQMVIRIIKRYIDEISCLQSPEFAFLEHEDMVGIMEDVFNELEIFTRYNEKKALASKLEYTN